MKKLKKEIVEAVNYMEDHPNESATSVAYEFEIDRHTLSKYFKNGIEDYKYQDDEFYYSFDEKEIQALEDYISHPDMTFTEINKKYHYKSTLFKNKLEIYGYNSERRYINNFNRHLFEEIKTEEDAYWLGFILADGYLNEDRGFLSIKLGVRDEGHLIKFCNYAQADPKVFIKNELGGVGQIVKNVVLNSREISNNLAKCGIFQGKSGKEKPYLGLPPELKPHYIRGIVDGDGWIAQDLQGFGLVGSYDICRYFTEDLGIEDDQKYIYEHKTIKRVAIRDHALMVRFINKYYKNASIYLDRKMELAQKFLKHSELLKGVRRA